MGLVRLACSTLTFNDRPLPGALAAIRALGFDHADLAVFPDPGFAHLQPAAVAADLAAAEAAVADACAGSGLAIAALNAGFGDAAGEEAHRQAMGLVLLAHRVGATTLTVAAGPGPVPAAAARLAPVVELGRRYNVIVAAEVHRFTVTERPEGALELLGRVPGLTLTFDPSHALIQGDGLADWDALYPHVAHVHLRDAGPGGWPRVQLPWGAGSLDLRDLFTRLDEAGYGGTLSVEYLRPAQLPEAPPHDPVESVRALKAAVEGLLAA